MYHWGYRNSSYLILPFLGPSTVRDTLGLAVDYYGFSPWPWIQSDWRVILLSLDFLDLRSRILRKETVLDVLAVDEYTFMRDAYFQHRQYLFEDSGKNAETQDNYGEDFFEGTTHSQIKSKKEKMLKPTSTDDHKKSEPNSTAISENKETKKL